MKHVIPKNDSKEHCKSSTCACMPAIHEEHGTIVHSCFDKREYFSFLHELDIVFTGGDIIDFYRLNIKEVMRKAVEKELSYSYFTIIALAEKWEDYELAHVLVNELDDE